MKRVEVSDHALVRWLERAHDIDMEFYRRQLAEQVQDAAAAGAKAIVIDGLLFCIRDGVLVSVVPARGRRPMAGRYIARSNGAFR
jgi:hypothetical protein